MSIIDENSNVNKAYKIKYDDIKNNLRNELWEMQCVKLFCALLPPYSYLNLIQLAYFWFSNPYTHSKNRLPPMPLSQVWEIEPTNKLPSLICECLHDSIISHEFVWIGKSITWWASFSYYQNYFTIKSKPISAMTLMNHFVCT
jgi:hypothetical protein